MADREKVIKGLENIVSDMQEEIDEWRDYSDSELSHGLTCDCEWWYNTAQKLKDAIALLKKQEPRVFNAGDFFGEEFGYLEYRSDRPGFSNFDPSPVLIGDIDEENVTVVFRSASVLKLPLDKMYKSWRIWSDYPTYELIRAVKWDG